MKRYCLAIALIAYPGLIQAADKWEYNRDIRPILAENCFACHGPDSATRKANLRLDQRQIALKKKAIVPGKPDESDMIARIESQDDSEFMPPPESHKKLTQQQKERLRQWVMQGAEYQAHWSLIAPQHPPLPTVKNTAWVRNPIDAYVLAELEKRGLTPSPEANRMALARRVSFDLTGLPPSWENVEAFVKDASPNAYEKYVDKLLASEAWGEHRGRYWLDYVRYADTHGIHFDNYREIWTYRQWVINAFNKNMPFDQFTVEQLAGDLLPNPTMEQKIATGFNRCNITTNEGGAIAEEYLVLYARDRTETVGQVYFGMTMGCAVCHDHKFDPLTARDFYSMTAFFNNNTQRGLDDNIKDTPPVIPVPTAQDRSRWEAVGKELQSLNGQIEERKKQAKGDFEKWLVAIKPTELQRSVPTTGLAFQALLAEGAGNSITALVDGQLRQVAASKPLTWENGQIAEKAWKTQSDVHLAFEDVGDFDTHQPFSFGAWVKPANIGGLTALFSRMEENNSYRGWDCWMEDGRVGTHIVSKWMDDALKVVTANPIPAKVWSHVFITYDGSGRADGVKIYVNGDVQEARQIQVDKLKGSIKTKAPFKLARRNRSSPLSNSGLQDVRVYLRELNPVEVELIAKGPRTAWIVTKPNDKRSEAEKDEVFTWWLPSKDKQFKELVSQRKALIQEQLLIKARGTVAYVMNERSSEPMAYVLKRGEYDKRLDPVKPDTPKMLPSMPSDLPHNRLGLAQWLLRPEHPLTARVTVNRFWQEVFGNGIVRTPGDFGATGELPTHPELLDWLAVEFRESGWDVKKLFKLIVMSSTYRQASTLTPEKLEKDPQNRYLSRGPRFRMDAETIRDNALAVSGLLVRKIGGPSVKPYQPEGVWEAVAMNESDTRIYRRDSGENLYRRSIYTFWSAAPPASLDLFNAPSREVCTVRRERTDTPLQALVTLNDVQFIEAARHLAQLTLKQGGDTIENRLDFLAKRLLTRPLRSEEVKLITDSLSELQKNYEQHPDDAKKLIMVGESKPDTNLDPVTLAAWTMLGNQLLNLDEVINK